MELFHDHTTDKIFCQNCSIEMIKKTKRYGMYGGKKIFIQCPKCGFNIRESSLHYYEEKESDEFNEIRDIINFNLNNDFIE